jgi:hypothetical protein
MNEADQEHLRALVEQVCAHEQNGALDGYTTRELHRLLVLLHEAVNVTDGEVQRRYSERGRSGYLA